MKHRKNYKGDKILHMLNKNLTYKTICKELNINSASISFYKKKFGISNSSSWECYFCKQKFNNFTSQKKGSHAKWCLQNPDRELYINQLKTKGVKHMMTSEAMEKKKKNISNAWKKGCYKNVEFGKSFKGKRHSEETKALMREKALSSKHRRLVKSTRYYTKKDGNVVLLDSSWEEVLAMRLDELNISWTRPEIPLQWIDNKNIKHNYFPDFYLNDYDLYIDPKNPAAYNNQIEKINYLTKTFKNIIFLKTLDECKIFKI